MTRAGDATVHELVDRCARGEQAAWRELVDRYSGLVYAVARTHHLPADSCDDVAQTTFSVLARSIGSLEAPEALASWLTTTAKRESWRVLRRQREQASPQALETGVEDSTIETLERHQRLREAVEAVGERCRDLLRALFFETDTPDYHVIAARFGIPVGSIGPTRARCLAKVAELLSKGGENND